jgi:N-acetylglutamate synthase-like GNAT family acetyltransferase
MNPAMNSIAIRPATPSDEEIIRQFVKIGNLPPISLKWPNFLVAERNGEPVGVGQIRKHGAVLELGSLVVLPEHRHQGIAARLVKALEAKNGHQTLYLFCELHMETYYGQFGYQRISLWQAPLRLIPFASIPLILVRLMGEHIILMRKS